MANTTFFWVSFSTSNLIPSWASAFTQKKIPRVINNPKNVISSGINANSQFRAIKKFQKENDLKQTLVLIPKKDYKEEIEEAIKDSKLNSKKIFYYDTEPTKLTKQN